MFLSDVLDQNLNSVGDLRHGPYKFEGGRKLTEQSP